MVAPIASSTPLPQSQTALPHANVRDAGQFPANEFTTIPNVPVFAEHETVTRSGRRLKYGRRELQLMANRCNRRIQESGDYAGLTIGHTPNKEQMAQGMPMPELVGFAGPFRIGTIGEGERTRYAILADLHVFNDDVPKVRKHPRRSPEVWLEGNYEQQFLDPIALLGAEPPRLDMGLVYARNAHGCEVEKYSSMAVSGPASPSAANTFIPSHGSNRRKQYAANEPQRSPSMLAPEDVKQFVDALEQLPWVQWCKQQMQAEQSPAAGAGLDDPAPPADDPLANAAPPAVPAPAAGPVAKPEDEERTKMMAGAAPALPAMAAKKPYAAGSVDGTETVAPASVDGKEAGPAKYSRLQAELAVQKRQIEALQAELAKQAGARVDVERYSALAEKAHYFAFDVDEELEICRYSKMSDEQFQAHLTRIDRNYREIPTGAMLHVPHDVPERFSRQGQPERYSKEHRDEAMRICEAKALAGEDVDYAAVVAQVAGGKKTA